jgi:hypothetical protein
VFIGVLFTWLSECEAQRVLTILAPQIKMLNIFSEKPITKDKRLHKKAGFLSLCTLENWGWIEYGSQN